MTSNPAKRHPPRILRVLNSINGPLLRRGWGPDSQYLLTIPGRRSGIPRTTPVAVLTFDTHRYIVGGYAGSDWVQNARVAGRATLTRGDHSEAVLVIEVPVEKRAPILQRFARDVRGGRAFLTVGANASAAAFQSAAAAHPVFRVDPPGLRPTSH